MSEEATGTLPSVTYSNSRWDLVWFNILMVFRARPNQLMLGFLLLSNGCMSFGWTGLSVWTLLVFALISIATLLFVVLLTGIAVLLGVSARRNRAVLTKHTITLSPEGVIETTAFNRNQIYWRGVDRIVDAAGFVCLHPGQFSAYIIPGSAFATTDARRAFIDYANRQLALAHAPSGA